MIRLPPISTLFPYTTLFRPGLMPHTTAWVKTRCSQAATSWPSTVGVSFVATIALDGWLPGITLCGTTSGRSEEHTSELQSQSNLVCRLLLEKKKKECNRTHD